MQENQRNGQDDSDIVEIANLLQSRQLHWTDALFRQRTITGSSKGQLINREVISQPVVVVQKV